MDFDPQNLDEIVRMALGGMGPEQMYALGIPSDMIEAVAADIRARDERKTKLVQEMEKKCGECMVARTSIEHRMLQDERQYYGQTTLDYPTKAEKLPTGVDSDAPNLNMTRSRTDSTAARISDMLFPTNEPLADLDVDPYDESPARLAEVLAEMQRLGIQRSAQATDDESAAKAELRRRAEAMQAECMRTLQISGFNQIARQAVTDWARVGTGVIKGPVASIRHSRRIKKRPVPTESGLGMMVQIDIEETSQPQFIRVDPWYFFPELVSDLGSCSRTYELHLYTRKDMRDLAKMPRFSECADVIEDIISKDPESSAVTIDFLRRRSASEASQEIAEKYTVWEFHGILSKEEMECLGVGIPADLSSMQTFMAEVWFCQGKLLKASISKQECDYRVPYYVISPWRIDDTPFGVGVPYKLRERQKNIQSIWQMTLHHASVSAGWLMFVRDDVRPADGKINVRGPKIFQFPKTETDPSRLVHVQTFPNELGKYLELLENTISWMDQELNLPTLIQGQESAPIQTTSGLAMIANNANVYQRNIASIIDKDLIAPAFERLVMWLNLYSDKDDIKGNYIVQPRGATTLVVKDIRAQHMQAFMAMAQNPRYAPYCKPYAELDAFVGMLEIDKSQLLLSEAEGDQRAQQGQTPPDLQHKMALIELERAKLAEDARQFNEKLVADLAAAEVRRDEANLLYQAKIAGIALQEKITLQEVEAALTRATEQEVTKRMKIGADAELKAKEIADRQQKRNIELAVESPARLA